MRKIFVFMFLFVFSLTSVAALTSCTSEEYDIVGTFVCVEDEALAKVVIMTFKDDNIVILQNTFIRIYDGDFVKGINEGTWERKEKNLYATEYSKGGSNEFKIKRNTLTDSKKRKYTRIDMTADEYIATYAPQDYIELGY